MASLDEQLDENFTEAANHWNLEKLYLDLAVAKGRGLTPVEKKFLRGLLCGYSPAEIAAQVYKSGSSSAVRVYLSNGLYKYIQELLLQQGETGLQIKNWSRITNLLEKAGYKLPPTRPSPSIESGAQPTLPSVAVSPTLDKYQEWQEVRDLDIFYGRQKELTQLEQWIVKENCRLLVLLGMGGIGKTALTIKLAKQIGRHFDHLIWRSLASAPSFDDFLEDLIQAVSQGQAKNLPSTPAGKIARLMAYLRSYRCLLVLDHVEAIFHPQALAGSYRDGYEGYSQLFRHLAEEQHRSCCLLTSREKPKDIAVLAGTKLPVRTFLVGGMKMTESLKLLHGKGQRGSEEEQQSLVRIYANNPLILKTVATTIQDVFDGNITKFFAEGTFIFGDIRELLDQQFYRLCPIEQQVLYELVIPQTLLTLIRGSQASVSNLSKSQRLEALESLQRRGLIEKATPPEKKNTHFTQAPVLQVYIAQKLSEQMAQKMTPQDISGLLSHILLNALRHEDSMDGITPTNEMLKALLTHASETNKDVIA